MGDPLQRQELGMVLIGLDDILAMVRAVTIIEGMLEILLLNIINKKKLIKNLFIKILLMEHTVPEPEYGVDYDKNLLDLLKDLERRNFDLRTNHNTAYFTFIWFIITIIAVFLWFNNSLWNYIKYIFLWSIIFLVIWFYLFFEESAIGIRKMENIYKISAKAERNDPSKSLEENSKKTCWEKFIWKTYPILQKLWLLLFIIWIVVYVAS